jgi:hypothetical protein
MNKLIHLLLPIILSFAGYHSCARLDSTQGAEVSGDKSIKELMSSNFMKDWNLSKDGKISCRIIPQYDLINSMEMIYAVTEIKNISQETLAIGPHSSIYDFRYEMSGPNGTIDAADHSRGRIGDRGAAKYASLTPGQILRSVKIMDYKGTDIAGKYQVKNTYEVYEFWLEDTAQYGINNLWIGSITSKPVFIERYPKGVEIHQVKNISFDEPWEPLTMCSYCGGGRDLRWQLSMQENVSTFDSIWLESMLMNVSKRTLTFEIDVSSAKPLLVLIPHGKEPIIRPLEPRAGLEYTIYNRKPPGAGGANTMHAFRVQLRDYFGDLEEGWYQTCVIWPAKGYSFKNLPDFKPGDLVSPIMNFHVSKTELKDSEKRAVPLRFRVQGDWKMGELYEDNKSIKCDPNVPINKSNSQHTGTIVNNYKEGKMYVPYYARFDSEQKEISRDLHSTVDWHEMASDLRLVHHARLERPLQAPARIPC